MWSIFKAIFRPLPSPSLLPTVSSKLRYYYNGPEIPLPEIESRLVQYHGGSVDLNVDEISGIATICINHLEKRNAISGKMMVDLNKIITTLETWQSGKGVIIYGSNHTFCSGGDLDFARKTSGPEPGFHMACFMQNVLNRLEQLPFITVALIEGSGALGGGAEIAVACDFRLIMESAAGIGFVHSRMGIVPAWGGATRLIGLVGYQTALEMLTTAKIISPLEALKISLVNDIITSKDPLAAAKEWLKYRTKGSVEVVHALKSIAHNARSLPREIALSEERRLFAPLWGGSANQNALAQNIKHKI